MSVVAHLLSVQQGTSGVAMEPTGPSRDRDSNEYLHITEYRKVGDILWDNGKGGGNRIKKEVEKRSYSNRSDSGSSGVVGRSSSSGVVGLAASRKGINCPRRSQAGDTSSNAVTFLSFFLH